MYTIPLLLLAQMVIFRICYCQNGNFDLLLFHSNNINFYFDEDEGRGGGAARALHILNRHRNEWKFNNGPAVLYLNAGDNFSFSRSYTVNKSLLIADYLNVMSPDAVCLGNHDLNAGLRSLKQFLDRLTAPVLVSNVEFDSSTGLKERIERSRVFRLGNRTVGVVGVTTSKVEIPFLPKGVSIGDEIEAVRRESAILHKNGVSIIVALIHSDCEMDKTIARVVEHVDVIVAGRRTSCNRNAQMKFEEIFRQKNGKHVPIVHEPGHLEYLGKIRLRFDDNGNLIMFTTDPILLHKKIQQAPDALKIDERQKIVARSESLGICRTSLSSACNTKECNFANLVADALIEHRAERSDAKHLKYWTDYPIAMVSSGIFRRSILQRTTLTKSQITNSIVAEDTLILIKIQGDHLKEAIIQASKWFGYSSGYFPQFSGLRVTLNMTIDGPGRIERITARCSRCDIPSYGNVLPNAPYSVIVNFLMYTANDALKKRTDFTFSYKSLANLTQNYIRKYKTVTPEMQDRLVVIGGTVKFGGGNVLLRTMLSVMLIAWIYCK